MEPWGDLLASVPSGLSRFNGSSVGPVRVTWATASPEVAPIRPKRRASGRRRWSSLMSAHNAALRPVAKQPSGASRSRALGRREREWL